MSDALSDRVHRLWEAMSGDRVCFPAAGRTAVVVSAASRISPAGWIGLVRIGSATLMTTPDADRARLLQQAATRIDFTTSLDPELIATVLPVSDVLGPTNLAYVSPPDFRPVAEDSIEPLDPHHPDVVALTSSVDPDEAGESGIGRVHSPVFLVRRSGVIAAASGYEIWPERTAHLCVLTATAWRGQGLARAAATAAVSDALAAGLLPQWRARVIPSQRVARALGFQDLGTQLSIHVEASLAKDICDEVDPRTSLGT